MARWNKVTLVGVGLLGGSLGLALRQRSLANEVSGYVRRAESIAECLRFKAVDSCSCDLKEAISQSDLVVVCTPLGTMRELGKQLAPHLKPGAIVTDVGSVKKSVIQDLEELVHSAGAFFVGSHPMAGGEKMGVSAARSDLFHQAVCVVTPTPQTNEAAKDAVMELWQSVGGQVMSLSPEEHDQLVSRSSHLPHVVAAELVNYVLCSSHPPEQARLCAGGFRDTTRIASGSPEMWRDIALANHDNLQAALDFFIQDLQQFQSHLKQRNSAAIEQFFASAKAKRDGWRKAAETPPPTTPE